MPLSTTVTNHLKAINVGSLATGTKYAFSLWFYVATGETAATWLTTTNARVELKFASSQITLILRNSSDTILADIDFGDVTEDQWQHIAISGTTGSTPTAYLDGVAVTPTENTNDAGNIGWADTEWLFGNATANWQDLIVYQDTLVLSTASILARFRHPSSRNQQNQASTGVDFLPLSENSKEPLFAIGTSIENRARRLAPTKVYEVGQVLGTSTLDGPLSDQWSAQGFRGEEWKECELCGWVFPSSELTIQPETNLRVCTTGPHDFDEPIKTGSHKGRGVFLG
jgi:hypothetical protein